MSQQQQQQIVSTSQGQQTQQQNGQRNEPVKGGGQDAHYSQLQEVKEQLFGRLQVNDRIESATGLRDLLQGTFTVDKYFYPPYGWESFRTSKVTNFPAALLDEYTRGDCQSYMGLFPEIERVWMSINNRLFLWDYQNGEAVSSYDGTQGNIYSAALARPKLGILNENISYVLVISTASKVRLVGVSSLPLNRSPNGRPSFELYELDRDMDTEYGCPLESIVSTTDGRIFGISAHQDTRRTTGPGVGEIYEIIYSSQDSFFSSKAYLNNLTSGTSTSGVTRYIMPSFLRAASVSDPVVLICVDQERNFLYTKTANNVLELWNLQKGRADKVATVKDIRALAAQMCQGHPLLSATSGPYASFVIISIDIISTKQGGGVGMVATTNFGVRLYFEHLHGALRGGYPSSDSTSPACFHLTHVRLPPRDVPASFALKSGFQGLNTQPDQSQKQQQLISSPLRVDGVCVPSGGGGITLMTNAVGNEADENDEVYMFSPDFGPILHNVATGSGTRVDLLECVDRIRAGNQVPEGSPEPKILGRVWAIAESPATARPLGQQYPGNELSLQLSTFTRREWLLLTGFALHFIQQQRLIDTLIFLLAEAAAAKNLMGVVTFAQRYGEVETCAMLLAITSSSSAVVGQSSSSVSQDVHYAAVEAFSEAGVGGRPVSAQQVQRGVGVRPNAMRSTDGQVYLSARHEGLALYLARLVAPILTKKVLSLTTNRSIVSTVQERMLSGIKCDLSSLQNALTSNPSLFSRLRDYSTPDAYQAYKAEDSSVHNTIAMLKATIEAISFIDLLTVSYRLPEVLQACPPDLNIASKLLDMSYVQLITTSDGRDVARHLVSAIIDIQIGQSQSVDAISEKLSRTCGNFCSEEDVILYRAIENIRKAKSGSTYERTECLREALRLFKKAAPNLTGPRVTEVVSEFNSLHFYAGSVDLSLTCASAWDQQERGVAWWSSGRPRNDSREQNWEQRNFCYSKVLETLESANSLLDAALQDGQRAGTQSDEAESIRRNAFAHAHSTPDRPFHFVLYDWYLAKGFTDQFLDLRSDFVEDFLLREPADIDRYDLLWQYYARHQEYRKAAYVLATLADSTEFDINLDGRLGYLSLAASNARSQMPDANTRQETFTFLSQIDEKLEVGAVQMDAYSRIKDLPDLPGQHQLLNELDSRLYAIQELHDNFATKYELYDLMLVIYHCVDFSDVQRIAAVWCDLIQQVIAQSENPPFDALSREVKKSVQRVYPSNTALPLPFLVSMLEDYTATQMESVSAEQIILTRPWLLQTFYDAGIPYEVLWGAYDVVVRTRLSPTLGGESISPWSIPQRFSYLIQNLALLLLRWLDAYQTPGTSESQQPFPAGNVERSVTYYQDQVYHGEAERLLKELSGRLTRTFRKEALLR